MRGKAVVFEDRNRVAVREVDMPDPGPNDVVIDVQCSWISIGTESSFLRGERISGERMYRCGDPWPFPMVAGYQKVGVIQETGAGVRGLTVGDTVFASVSKVSDMFFDYGGHLSPAVTPADQVWKLPVGARAEDYAGMVLTQVGYNCGSRPEVHPGDVAIVIGDGLVGQWSAQTLFHRGANVVVLGRHDERLAYLACGVNGINARRDFFANALSTMGRIRVVVDSVGDLESVRSLMPFMDHNAHIVSAGFLGDAGLIDIQVLREKEITLHTPSGWSPSRMDQTLQAIAEGWLVTSPLVTHRFPVDQAQEAWNRIRAEKHSVLGVLLDW